MCADAIWYSESKFIPWMHSFFGASKWSQAWLGEKHDIVCDYKNIELILYFENGSHFHYDKSSFWVYNQTTFSKFRRVRTFVSELGFGLAVISLNQTYCNKYSFGSQSPTQLLYMISILDRKVQKHRQRPSIRPLVQQPCVFICETLDIISLSITKFGTHFPGVRPSTYYGYEYPLVKTHACYRVIINQFALLRCVWILASQVNALYTVVVREAVAQAMATRPRPFGTMRWLAAAAPLLALAAQVSHR